MKVFNLNDFTICINDADLKGQVHVSLSVGIGLGTRIIKFRGEEILLGSATAKVYFNYFKRIVKQKFSIDTDCDVIMNSATISWEDTKNNYSQNLQNIINELYYSPIENDIFYEEKEQTLKRYSRNYKSLEFRGRMKILEFSNKNKNFKVNNLSSDLLDVDLDKINFMREKLFFPKNTFIFIHGKGKKEVVKEIEFPKINNNSIEAVYQLENFYLLGDESLHKQTKGNYQCGCIKFERIPTTIDLTFEHVLLSIIGEIMFKGLHQVKVDKLDANILYFETPLKRYKYEIFNMLTEENVEQSKSRFLKKFDRFIGNNPRDFTHLASELFFNKIDIYVWYETIKSINLSEINKFLKQRDYKIREGYLKYVKGDEYGII